MKNEEKKCTCRFCEGSGMAYLPCDYWMGLFDVYPLYGFEWMPCPVCNGTGYVDCTDEDENK